MSYSIVYAREFIKTGDGRILPLVLCGSNNCWTIGISGRESRERHWNLMYIGNNEIPALFPKQLIKKVKAYIPSEYQQHFMRNGMWVDDAGLIRFFENGIKKAKTLEEINDELLVKSLLCGEVYYYKGYDAVCIHSSTIKSTEQLDDFLSEADRLICENKDAHKLYVDISFDIEKPLEREKVARKKKERLKQFYVVTTKFGYVSSLTRSGIYSTHSADYAKQFKTEKEAVKWIKDRDIERRFRKSNFGVEYMA